MGSVVYWISRLTWLFIDVFAFVFKTIFKILQVTGMWIFFLFFIGINLIMHQKFKAEYWYMHDIKAYLIYLAIVAAVSLVPWLIIMVVRVKK